MEQPAKVGCFSIWGNMLGNKIGFSISRMKIKSWWDYYKLRFNKSFGY